MLNLCAHGMNALRVKRSNSAAILLLISSEAWGLGGALSGRWLSHLICFLFSILSCGQGRSKLDQGQELYKYIDFKTLPKAPC